VATLIASSSLWTDERLDAIEQDASAIEDEELRADLLALCARVRVLQAERETQLSGVVVKDVHRDLMCDAWVVELENGWQLRVDGMLLAQPLQQQTITFPTLAGIATPSGTLAAAMMGGAGAFATTPSFGPSVIPSGTGLPLTLASGCTLPPIEHIYPGYPLADGTNAYLCTGFGWFVKPRFGGDWLVTCAGMWQDMWVSVRASTDQEAVQRVGYCVKEYWKPPQTILDFGKTVFGGSWIRA
jgi:hypothetical protein